MSLLGELYILSMKFGFSLFQRIPFNSRFWQVFSGLMLCVLIYGGLSGK